VNPSLHSRVATYVRNYSLAYSLTLCTRGVFLDANRFSVKKFPSFYGTRRFVTAFTSARRLSLSGASSIQSILPHPTSGRSILILSPHLNLGLPSDLLPSCFPTKILYTPLLFSIRAACPAHPILLDFINQIMLGEEYRSSSSLLSSFLHSLVTSSLLGPNILLTPYSQTHSAYVLPSMSATKLYTQTKKKKTRQNYSSVNLNLYIFR